MKRVFYALMVLLLSGVTQAEMVETFPPGRIDPAWKWSHQEADQSSLRWPKAEEPNGLAFNSRGVVKLERPIDPIDGSLEAFAEIEFERGKSDSWRNNGIVIAISSAPVDQMKADDWTIYFAAIQQGAVCTVRRGGARWGGQDAKRPDLWNFAGGDIAKRGVLTTAGGGGSDYSAQWPGRFTPGQKLRYHAWRDSAGVFRVTLHTSQGPGGPWWESETPTPKDVTKPLQYVTVFVSQEPGVFKDPQAANKATEGGRGDGGGNGLFAGRITAINVAPVQNDKPKFNNTFPAEPIKTEAVRAKGTPSAWLPKGGVEELRKKFNDPMFASHKAIILHNARELRTNNMSSPNNFDVMAQTWAYILTGEQRYFDNAMKGIDAQVGVRDVPDDETGGPGKLRQLLSVHEFQVHRYETLSHAYDLLYDQIEPARREAMHRAMLRALDHYVRQTDSNDWWYANNPSNTIGVGNGASALIAVALRHEHPTLAEKVIDRAVKQIKSSYVGVADDGGCNEGNMYWNYGMSYPLALGYVLRNADGDDRGMLRSKKIENAHRYVETNLGGDGLMIPFNDTQPWLNGWVPMAAASSEYDRPLLRWMVAHMAAKVSDGTAAPEQARGPYAVFSFLLRDTKPAPKEFPGLPTLSHLASIHEGVLRSDGNFVPKMVVGIKGNGQQNTHHANHDQGSFVFYANGDMLLLDPGYFNASAHQHSLPLIGEDPAKIKLMNTAVAPIQDAWEAGDVRSMTVDATKAHQPKDAAMAKRVRRVFVTAGDNTTVVLDDIVPAKDGDKVNTLFQAASNAPTVEGNTATIKGKNGSVLLQWDGPAIQATTTPQKFTRWVYQKAGYEWSTVNAAYQHEADKPLVTVLTAAATGQQPAAATVVRQGDSITVKTAAGREIKLAKTDGLWTAVKP